MKFKNKTVVITGASRGIGKAIALAMAREGANIAINYYLSDEMAQQTVSEIKQIGTNVISCKCDVADQNQVKNFFSKVISSFQKIDILINNAGIVHDKPLMFMNEEEWEHVININLKGAFLCLKAAVKEMVKNKYGRIVNISSDAGLTGDLMRASYAASKAGIIGLTKSAARELSPFGITVNAVAPGFVETAITQKIEKSRREKIIKTIPMQRFATPQEIAEAVLFLASDDAQYITGEILIVDGGMYTR